MIRLSHLRKEFDNTLAVQDLSLEIPQGEIYGLIGPNGAGKTTTIRMVCGLLRPTDGQVSVFGVDVLAQSEAAQEYVGYLSDFFSVYEDLKVWEYLDYFAHAYKMSESDIAPRIAEVISQSGLDAKRDALIRGLSRGMKQRLGIARAIIHRPKVLLLDEPASGLDPKARMELRDLLRSLREQGATILISSHILTELEGLCTSVGIMEKGQLLRTGPIADVTTGASPAKTIRLAWIGDGAAPLGSLLASNPQVAEAQLLKSEGTFQFSGTPAELAGILASCTAAGIPVVSFTEVKQTVEDLYMKISRHEVM